MGEKDSPENLRGAVALCHFFLRERVKPGDRAVDATSSAHSSGGVHQSPEIRRRSSGALDRFRFRGAINIGQLMLRRPAESWVGADGGVDNEIPSTAHTTLS